MPFFVIAGKLGCKDYMHAKHVGNYLKQKLPDFNVRMVEKQTGEWEPWLVELNENNRWYHTKSPVIWKELCSRGGRAYLIGNLSDFWEYCYDYYNLESLIPTADLIVVAEDYVKHLENSKLDEDTKNDGIFKICITGASNPVLELLLPELCSLTEFDSDLEVRFVDRDIESPDVIRFIKDMHENVTNLSLERTVILKALPLLQDALPDCDLLIIADYFKRYEIASRNDLIEKKIALMLYYSDTINAFAKKQLRIVLTDCDPCCLCASVLVETLTKVRVTNIVAVTSDVGLGYLGIVSKHIGVALEYLGAPPVWGCIGINEFVDFQHIVKYSEVYYPFSRSISLAGDSTLPKGKVKPELRFLSYLINEEDCDKINNEVQTSKNIMIKKLYCRPTYSTIRATISLLKLWYSKEESDEIISLGVVSNGAFGIPNGIVFSQPVMLNDKKIWQPFRQFPITKNVEDRIKELVADTRKTLDSFGVGKEQISNYV